MDNVNAKHTFLNSLLEPLGDETLRMMNLQKKLCSKLSWEKFISMCSLP